MKYKDLSPARQLYVKKQADKQGITLKAYLDAKYGTKEQVKKYPFTQIEDATFRLEPQHTATQEIIDLYKAHRQDYGDDKIKDNFYDVGEEITNLQLVKIGDHTVGFIMTLDGISPKGKFSLLENVYVKPQYRGWGVASRIYRQAIDSGIAGITLAWDRITTQKQQAYWSSVGYKMINLMPGQASADESLVYVSADGDRMTPTQWPLSEAIIARHHCRNINLLIHQRLGFSPSRMENDQYIDIINDVTVDYLTKKNLLKVEA